MKEAFESIKVMDFSWAGVGPMVSRVLAEHGATVIRVESHNRPDSLRFAGPFLDGKPGLDRSAFGTAYNTNKHSISLDMTKAGSREIIKKLIIWSDIVGESFTPGTMHKWGLDYESVIQFKPDIICYSTCQQGQWGPHAKFSGYGFHAAALSGIFNVTGWPDRAPSPVYGAYIDYISPWYLAAALIAALDRRRKTGKGMYLEQSQMEAGVNFLGPSLPDYSANGRVAGRMGNRHPHMAPHGAFRAKGDDRWVVIAVRTDEEWEVFSKVMGGPEWTRDPKFATGPGRKENEDELEQRIHEWTANFTPKELMTLLQKAGVAACAVQRIQELFEDPQVQHRKAFEYLTHPVIGRHAYNTPAFRLSKSPWQPKKAGPALGESNEWVLKEILGLSDDEIAELLIEGVITTEANVPW